MLQNVNVYAFYESIGTDYRQAFLLFKTENQHQWEYLAVYDDQIMIESQIWGSPKTYKKSLYFKDYNSFKELLEDLESYCNNDIEDKVFYEQFVIRSNKKYSISDIIDIIANLK